MAGGTPSGTIGTRISMDGSQPIETMKQLREAVKSLTNGWKAQEVELKSAGDYLNAAKARFDGLSESIKQQQGFIQRLKNEQNGLDTSTQEGSTRFAKLSEQINQATIKMGSMQGQLDRAKNSMNYYKSGIGELQSEMKRASSVSDSYVKRLQAEGKESEAMKVKSDSLHSSLSKMSELYAKQESELARIATESGKTSSAYAKQAVRVNELGTKMAEARSEANHLDSEISKTPTTWFGKARVSLANFRGESQKAEKSSSRLGDIIKGSFVGTALTNGLSTVTSGLKNMVSEGLQFAEAGEKNQVAWKQMGLSAGDIKYLTMEVGELKKATGFAGGEITSLQKKFYGMTQSEGLTENLTRGVTALAVASGKGADSADAVASSMRKINASGKLTSQSYQKLIQQVPALPGKLSEAMGMTKDQLNKAVADGSISSQKFQDAIVKIGATSGKTFQEFGKTSDGAIAQFKGSWQSIEAATAKPIVDVKSSGIESLTNVLNSKATQQMFTNFGKGIAGMADAAGKALGYISQHQSDIGGIIGSLSQITKLLFDGAWKVVSGTINGIAGAFDKLSGNSKKTKDPIKNLNKLLGYIAKHKKGIEILGGTIATAFAAKKVIDFSLAVAGFVAANPLLAIVGAVAAVGVALFELYKHNKKFRDFVNGIGKAAKKGFDKVVKIVKGTFKTIGEFFTGKLGWEKAIGKEVGKVSKSISSGFNSTINWIRKWAGNFIKTIGNALKPIGKVLGTIWNGLKKAVKIAFEGIKIVALAPIVVLAATMVAIWKKIQKPVETIWKAMKKTAQIVWKGISDAIIKPVENVFKSVSSVASDIWKSVVKTFTNLGKDISNIWNNIQKWTSNAWDAVVKFVSKPVDAIWDKVTTVFGKLSSWIGNTLGDIKKVWHDVWDDVSSFFSGIWDGIKSAGKNGINGVIDFLNGGINGIDSVISFFGGDKKAIKEIPKLASGTVNGRLAQDTLAILNDGHDSPETGNKEMIVKKDGRAGIVQGTDVLTHLEAGDAVVNAHDTKRLMAMRGIEHFAIGSGWIDKVKDVTEWVGDKFDDVGKWIGDKVKAIETFAKNPVGEITKVFDKFTSGFSHLSDLTVKMAKPAGHYVIKQGEKWFKKLFDKLNDDLSAPSGSGVQRWKDQVKKALEQNGLSDSESMIDRILRQIQTESGGNERASQHGDPDGDGSGPAMGLMQTKRNTFNHYAFPGHKDIWNGYDSLLAGLAYAKATYGPSLSFLGNGHGYANGGLISKHGMYEVGENNLSEMIIPMSSVKSSRGYELLGKAAATMAARDGMGGTNDGNQAELELMQQQNSLLQGQVKRLDNIIDLFSGLFTGNGSLSALVNLIDKQRYANMTTQKPQRLGLEGI